MQASVIFACGNCVYSALRYQFPAIDSCVWIFPIWLIVLSALRTFGGAKLAFVPSLPITLGLLFLVVLLAPAMIGPPLGFWIPISCFVGTYSALKLSKRVRTAGVISASVALVALIGFGIHDYVAYYTLDPEERLERVSPLYRPNVDTRQQEQKH